MQDPKSSPVPNASTRRACILLAVVAVALHAANLLMIAWAPSVDGVPAWHMYDTRSYLDCADALISGQPMPTAFRERPLVPVLIVAARSLGLADWHALWPSVLLQFPATLAVAALAFRFVRRRWAAVAAAILYATLPNMFQYVPLLGTDALNAQFMIIALAATVGWADTGDRRLAVLGCLCWAGAQLARPTFFPVAVAMVPILLPLLWKRGQRLAVAIYLASCGVVPTVQAVVNYAAYGIASPSLTGAEFYHRVLAPKIRTEQRVSQGEPRSKVWTEERDVLAVADPDWRALRYYEAVPHDRESYRSHYDAVIAKNVDFVRSNRWWLVQGIPNPVYHQFLTPPRFRQAERAEDIRPGQDRFLLNLHKVAMIIAIMSLGALIRRFPLEFLGFAGVAALVLLPMGLMMWLRSSARLPLELLVIPIGMLGLSRVTTWAGLAVVGIAGIAPRLLFGASEAWMGGVILVVFVVTMFHSVVRAPWFRSAIAWRPDRAGRESKRPGER